MLDSMQNPSSVAALAFALLAPFVKRIADSVPLTCRREMTITYPSSNVL
jgi:hypothetical protein